MITIFSRVFVAVVLCLAISPVSYSQNANNNNSDDPIDSFTLNIVVVDKDGRRITDLKKEDFEIYEDGVKRNIVKFKPGGQSLRLILLFDTSVSMVPEFRTIRDETAKMMDELDVMDEILIASFDTHFSKLTAWVGRATAGSSIADIYGPNVAAERKTQPKVGLPIPFPRLPGGGPKRTSDKNTNLFDSVRTAFQQFERGAWNDAIILISDGEDTLAGAAAKDRTINDAKQMIKTASQTKMQLFGACFSQMMEINNKPFKTGYKSDCNFMASLASATGGRSFEFNSANDLALIYKKLFDEMRDQYTISFANEFKSGDHKIEVKVNKPDLTVRHRLSYSIK